ncbi:hypothetical protein INT45_013266 [Circinella minor]|uniref:Uncharacterized protein n=1 Tax=Circinella minor TaxID=1195481 RepID=A0A8H7VIM3_9FUNG|nr:hypothetical protein INT45_013266 [Circinella minor]
MENHSADSKLPMVCGILAQGKHMSKDVMDMISPQLYRCRQISKVDVCFTTLSQLNSFITMVLRLFRIKVFYVINRMSSWMRQLFQSETVILSNTKNKHWGLHISFKHELTVDNDLLSRKKEKEIK